MTLWSSPDGRAALALGGACWVQLCLAPTVAQRVPTLAALSSAAALAALVVGGLDLARRPRWSVVLATAGFLSLCAFTAASLGATRVPRLDLGSRLLAAITAAGYVALAARALSVQRPRLPGTITPVEELSERAPVGPRWRVPATAAVALVALGCAVVLPAAIGAAAQRGAGVSPGAETLLRGRGALTAAGGLALALAVALSAGASLLRAPPPRPRRAARAFTYGVWAAVAWTMRLWLDRAR